MKRTSHKILSVFLSVCMIVSCMVGMSLTASADDTVTIDMTTQGWANEQAVTTVSDSSNTVTINFSKGDGNNPPRYYNTGAAPAVRLYGQNTMTVSSNTAMTSISITFGSSDGSNTISVNTGTLDGNTWSGEAATSVTFTVGGTSGNRRIKALSVTLSGSSEPEPPHTHTWRYAADGATITANCGEGCDITTAPTITVTAPALTQEDGTESAEAALTKNDTWTADIGLAADPTISYYQTESEGATTGGTALNTAPATVGNYYAQITIENQGADDATAAVAYTIAPKDPIELTFTSADSDIIWFDNSAAKGWWEIHAENDDISLWLSDDGRAEAAGSYTWDDMYPEYCGFTANEGDVHFVDGSCEVTIDGETLRIAGTFAGDDGNTYVVNITSVIKPRIEITLSPENSTVSWNDSTDTRERWVMLAATDDVIACLACANTTEAAGEYNWADMYSQLCVVKIGEEFIYFEGGFCEVTITGETVNVAGSFVGDDGNIYDVNITGAVEHNFVNYVQGATLTMECTNEGCTLNSITLTVVAPTLTVEGGEGNEKATVTQTGVTLDFLKKAIPNISEDVTVEMFIEAIEAQIVYEGTGDTDYEVSYTAPTKAGTYTASIYSANPDGSVAVASVAYEIKDDPSSYRYDTPIGAGNEGTPNYSGSAGAGSSSTPSTPSTPSAPAAEPVDGVAPGTVFDVTDREANTGHAYISDSMKVLADAFLTDDDLAAMRAGSDIKVWLTVTAPELTPEEQAVAEAAVAGIDGAQAALYLDIQMFKQIGSGEVISIHQLNSDIEISIQLPEGIRNTDPGILRRFYVVRLHGGALEVIECSYDKDTNTLKFYTDRFSAYIIGCVDVELTDGVIDADDDDDDDTDIEIDDGIIEPTEKPVQEADVEAAGETNPHTGADLPGLAVLALSAAAAALTISKRRK